MRRTIKPLPENLVSQDRVRFIGMIPYDDLPAHLAMCDAFVTASVTEVHPLSVIEGMATGLPILGIDSPGVGRFSHGRGNWSACDKRYRLLYSQTHLPLHG